MGVLLFVGLKGYIISTGVCPAGGLFCIVQSIDSHHQYPCHSTYVLFF